MNKYINNPQKLPPALCLLFFLLLFLLLRFSPYSALDAFLERPYSTRFYDRRETLVQIIPLEDGIRREYADIETIPPSVPDVFLTAEDERFFYHFGIDPLSVLRAMYQNIRAGRRISGASTVTMQLARIIAAPSRRNIFSKAAELFNALRLEARFSKKEILGMYLNSIPFGFQTEGLASAARNFFASEIAFLTPAEVFCLAVIPRRPAAYNPLTEKAACINAAEKLALRFADNSRRASAYPLYASLTGDDWNTIRPARFAYPRYMPHMVRYVHRRLREQTGRTPPDYVLSADLNLQRAAEDLIAAGIRRQAASRLSTGAAVVIDNLSGEVLAWVGSADYDDERAGGQIDGVLAKNQMGSSMKPFLYALALEHGYKPADVLADIPSKFGSEEVYIPRNFNNRFNGPVLLRIALGSSLNIPAVHLLDRLGIQNYGRFLALAGFDISPEEAEDAGLGLALGNAPVSLEELAAAFSIFPRDGQKIPLRFDKTESGTANPGLTESSGLTANSGLTEIFGLEEIPRAGSAVSVMSADTARLICSMLSDRRARLLGFGRGGNFETPFPAIFKTGTANQFQNIVALGATPRFTAAVWMGNFTGETVIGRTGSSLPASVVRSLLMRLHSAPGSRNVKFREPSGWVRVPVCALSGLPPSGNCPYVIEEYFPSGEGLAGTAPAACNWHHGGAPVYPPEYQNWFLSLLREGELDYASAPLQIITPRDDYRFLPSSGGGNNSIPVEVTGGTGDELTVEHNGRMFTVRRPFVFFLPYTPGRHTLTVRSGSGGYSESDTVRFTAE
ncbi:MAG: transglycosylase domain-containing protein [Spirochaetaceae bacterium]|nr:transglycosylase domain-containing protein [Spirochaetaceae bacterium]